MFAEIAFQTNHGPTLSGSRRLELQLLLPAYGAPHGHCAQATADDRINVRQQKRSLATMMIITLVP